jgi:ketosteroid isomerase-like protein
MAQENVELVKAFFAAYNARDAEAIDQLLHRDAEITTLSGRAGLPYRWNAGATRQYFEQLDDVWAGFRVEIQEYRESGERVVALGNARGAGASSRVEVTSEFAVTFLVRNSRSFSSRPTTIGPMPSKPPGCGSRRCRSGPCCGESLTAPGSPA